SGTALCPPSSTGLRAVTTAPVRGALLVASTTPPEMIPAGCAAARPATNSSAMPALRATNARSRFEGEVFTSSMLPKRERGARIRHPDTCSRREVCARSGGGRMVRLKSRGGLRNGPDAKEFPEARWRRRPGGRRRAGGARSGAAEDSHGRQPGQRQRTEGPAAQHDVLHVA